LRHVRIIATLQVSDKYLKAQRFTKISLSVENSDDPGRISTVDGKDAPVRAFGREKTGRGTSGSAWIKKNFWYSWMRYLRFGEKSTVSMKRINLPPTCESKGNNY
jgi:hypothetical protein